MVLDVLCADYNPSPHKAVPQQGCHKTPIHENSALNRARVALGTTEQGKLPGNQQNPSSTVLQH